MSATPTAADLSRAKLQRQQDATDLAAKQKLLQQGAESPAEVAAAQHRVELDDSQPSTASSSTAPSAMGRPTGPAPRRSWRTPAPRSPPRKAPTTRADIRSPIAGTVYYLPVSQYDYVDTGDDLVYVADLNRMRITAYFDEPDIGNLAVGQPVKITWEAKPGVTWHGHISQVPTTIINYLTRFVGECLITVDDADGDPRAERERQRQSHHRAAPTCSAFRARPCASMARRPYVFRIIEGKLVRTPVSDWHRQPQRRLRSPAASPKATPSPSTQPPTATSAMDLR